MGVVSQPAVKKDGFTLIEILVVIAIIAILMGALFVGINPAARINEAKDARAKMDVAQLGSSLEACLTKSEGDETKCDTWDELYSGSFVKLASAPSGITVSLGCVSELGGYGTYCKYLSGTGKVDCGQVSGCVSQ